MSLMSEFDDFEIRISAWHNRIEQASSAEDVLGVMRDYAASITPQQLAGLPEKCRPGRLKAEDDIDYWAFVLAQHLCRPPEFDADFFQELLNHFLHASMRISAIRREYVRFAGQYELRLAQHASRG